MKTDKNVNIELIEFHQCELPCLRMYYDSERCYPWGKDDKEAETPVLASVVFVNFKQCQNKKASSKIFETWH